MSRFIDLTGQTFGRWTVLKQAPREDGQPIKWICKCSCDKGTIKEVRGTQLRNGRSQSCGCLAIENGIKKQLEEQKAKLIGKKFGHLTVLSFAGYEEKHSGKGRRTVWHCKCDCEAGNEIDVVQDRLVSGNITSCGCARHESPPNFEDITGQRFGELVVVEKAPSKNERTYWKCKCDCGGQHVVGAYDLKHGRITHCTDSIHLIKDKVGNKYGQLTVRRFAYRDGHRTFWYCDCDCGKKDVIVDGNAMLRGLTTSCGHKFKTACLGSTDELEIKDYILSLIPEVEIIKSRILDGKEIDLYLPKYKFGIEYNGSAFHASENGAFRNVNSKLHQKKFLSAKEQGIHLLTIFDVDWWRNKEKIKQYIKYCLISPSNRIYARQCTIESIDKDIANFFCDKYHLQGKSVYSKYNYGLFYNGNLISVMCFGDVRLKKHEDGYYELHRYCAKDDWQIVGGASKLQKAFEFEYSPKYIRSYSDNDYFSGSVYEKLGYDYSGQSNPRYYWFYQNREVKRELCQLKYLKNDYPDLYKEACDKNASNKEDYIMLKLNARKVYRSGNTLWEKHFSN